MSTSRTLVEVSWEVVNKVGGIHTVVASKADLMVDAYEEYLMVGPLFPGHRDVSFREKPCPERLRGAFSALRAHGVSAVYGTWLIKGSPEVVLIDASGATFDLDALKAALWERYGIDSLGARYDFDEPLRWAWAAGMLIENLSREERLVAHFHEWMAGFGLLYLDMHGAQAGTVFTTHATMLGRTASGATDIALYDELERIDADALARSLGVAEKHTTERACAHAADVFTTVSEITASEAERFFGRKPDILLYNGLEISKYPTTEEASLLHRRAREQMRDFLDYYFFSHYTFDLDESLTFFVSGRYEYKNKGLDILTEALGRLNEHLKRNGHRKTVVVFYFIPGDAHGIKAELLEERAAFSHLRQYLQDNMPRITRNILRRAGELDDGATVLSSEMREEVSRMASAMRHGGNPPLCTHNMPGEDDDAIISAFRAQGLDNAEDDRVKVIRYPIYLDGADGLLNMSYAEAVAGSHLGIFPSAYEPWGYTPVETAALAVPTVTTDLAGFGRFVADRAGKGVRVLARQHRSHEEIVEDLFGMLARFCDLDKYGRMEEKLAAQEISRLCDWEIFIKRYLQAHAEAYDAVE